MKRFILGGLSVLVLSAAVVPFATRTETARAIQTNVAPVTLVFLAKRGMLRERGIPGSGGLLVGYRAGRVTEETLVQAGIDEGILAPETINDRRYLRIVRNQLRRLGTDATAGDD
ncbi:hypothetical protein [Synechococcus sp. PCC 7336]|uniref:hypothetical protein n=1 Tax=Synechococcus sp. PCC 7336 TaxID=195250 RepID=UPI0003483342|nr:hypothetical protein [Synechococcus sp. PCC 7336]